MEKSISILKDLNSCITTLRLYPAENKLVSKNLDMLMNGFEQFFQNEESDGSFTVSLAEGRLILNGKAVQDKYRTNPIILSILSLFELLDLKSLSIFKGVSKSEMVSFFGIINELKSKTVYGVYSLQDIMTKRGITKIKADEAVYIAIGKEDREALEDAELDISRLVREKLLGGSESPADSDDVQVDRFYGDPDKVSKTLSSIISRDSRISLSQKNRNMTSALNRLANLIPEDREEYLVGLFSILKDIGPGLSTSFLMTRVATQKKPKIDADKLILYLDDNTLRAYAREVEKLHPHFIMQTEKLPVEKKQLYRQRVRHFYDQLEAYISSLGPVLDGASEEMQDDNKGLEEMIINDLSANLPKIRNYPKVLSLGKLFRVLEDSEYPGLLDEIKRSLYSDKVPRDDFLKYYTDEMFKIFQDSSTDQDTALKIVRSTLKQAERETELNIWYSSLITLLENSIPLFLERGYHDIISIILLSLKKQTANEGGAREKEQTYFAYCIFNRIDKQEYYKALTTLFLEGKTDESSASIIFMTEYPHSFTLPILNRLKESSDIKVRKRAVNFLSKAGESVIDPVIKELDKNQPWFVYRNLLAILGEIGFPSTVFIVKKFLLYKDRKVSKEAVRALLKIGSQSAVKVMAENFQELDDRAKLNILKALSPEQLPFLQETLKNYLEGNDLVSGNNKDLAESVFSSLQKISEKTGIDVLSDVLWGRLQHLLEFQDKESLLYIILNLLSKNNEPSARTLIERMAQDDRAFIKKPAQAYLKEKKG